MNINFSPVDNAFIKSMVDQGYYSNATEFVRDAVRRMREQKTGQKTDKQSQLEKALELGMQDIEAGRTVPYTKDFMDDCMKRARKNVANGIKPNPNVLPQ